MNAHLEGIRDRIQRQLVYVDHMGGGYAPQVLARLRQLAMTEASSAVGAIGDDDTPTARMYFNRLCGVVSAMEIVYNEMGG